MQWIPRQTPLYVGKSEGCRAIHYFLISAIKMWVLVQTASTRRLLRRFECVPTINDLRRNKKGIKIYPLKILFGKMQCIWMFSLWGKSGVCWGVHYFLISALKHRLWVLVRTDTSLRRFERVPIVKHEEFDRILHRCEQFDQIRQSYLVFSRIHHMWKIRPNFSHLYFTENVSIH